MMVVAGRRCGERLDADGFTVFSVGDALVPAPLVVGVVERRRVALFGEDEGYVEFCGGGGAGK